MTKLDQTKKHRVTAGPHWAWLFPILALSPLALAAKGCDNSGVVGDNCPTADECSGGSAGKGSGPTTPGTDCGGLLGKACADGQYCDYAKDALCGAADQTGVCMAKPSACDLDYSPVCGCDGKTYGNACSAHAAGISVASTGECDGGSGGTGSGGSGPGGGETCGGIAALSCPTEQYCNYPVEAKCGAADQTGVCTPIPQSCTKELNPVCGCDNVTYGNPCLAAAAGASISHLGECTSGGKACGQIGGCADGEFCKFPPEVHCGIADGPGVCTKVPPKGTACDAVYAPVCGCDGKTYGNDCEALVAGVSVAQSGACPNDPTNDCGGFSGGQCKDGYFCDYPPEMMCGIADGSGSCKEIPDACLANVDPVCGCDGNGYSNACQANSKGVSVAYKGACKK
jgi:hypothetical protein